MSLRPLTVDDAAAVQALAARAFDDLAVRRGRRPGEGAEEGRPHYVARDAHLVATGRAVGAFEGDELVGAALSTVRGDLWVLALLVVSPTAQGSGTGSALLRTVLEGAPPRRLLHASDDVRAVRAYSRAGFRLLPSLQATGSVSPDPSAPAVRDAPDDLPALVPFAVDLAPLRASDGRVLELADGRRGVAVLHRVPGRGSGVTVLDAEDDAAAADLLRGVLGTLDGPVDLAPLAPQEHWAVPVCLDAGLALAPNGPVEVAGVADPLAGPCVLGAVYV